MKLWGGGEKTLATDFNGFTRIGNKDRNTEALVELSVDSQPV